MDQPFDFTSYDAKHTLASVVAARRTADESEADLLAYVVHFCDLHPVVNPDDEAATWVTVDPIFGPKDIHPISGPGTPTVTVEAVHELTAALGISHGSGLNLVGQTLELRYRLPRLWALVQDLVLPAWQGKQVAEHTMTLSMEAAGFVDRHLAVAASRGTFKLGMVPGAVQLAVAQCDPEQAREVEEQQLAGRGVWFDKADTAAVTYLSATLDTVQALALDETLSTLATTLGRLGDTASRDVRRATALGMLADPQAVPRPRSRREAGVVGDALRAPRPHHRGRHRGERRVDDQDPGRRLAGPHRPGPDPARPGPGPHRQRGSARPADLAARAGDPAGCDLCVPRLPHRRPTPGVATSTTSSRFDDTGPPGQTSPANLACLCRRHHNAKTHRGWRYRRTAAGYEWTSPLGRTHTVPR